MNPKIIYHRGRHGVPGADGNLILENTRAAFAQAVAEGAGWIELDVWDNLVVAHDPGPSAVTLPEVLDLVAGGVGVNIEIKSPLVLSKVIKEVKYRLTQSIWQTSDFVLSAFHHATAVECKKQLSEVTVSVINDGVLLPEYIRRLADFGINNLHLEWSSLYMDGEAGHQLRETAQDLGMKIWTWTVNRLDIYEIVVRYGVDGVFTDRPDLFR